MSVGSPDNCFLKVASTDDLSPWVDEILEFFQVGIGLFPWKAPDSFERRAKILHPSSLAIHHPEELPDSLREQPESLISFLKLASTRRRSVTS